MSKQFTKKFFDVFSAVLFFSVMTVLIYSGYTQKTFDTTVDTELEPSMLSSSDFSSMTNSLSAQMVTLASNNVLIFENQDPVPLAAMSSDEEIIDQYIYNIAETRYPSLDPELIRAIVYHESRYDPTVINPKSGTTGLMQISPKWHLGRARSLGVEDLTDPYGNLLVGCDLLNELIRTYSQNYALDVYAGGYSYAESYKHSESPYVKEIYEIRASLRNGSIIPGR